MNIDDKYTFETPVISNTHYPSWFLRHSIDYEQYDDVIKKSSYIKFNILDSDKKMLGFVHLSFYLAATGP